MHLLLDTHVFLWIVADDKKLGAAARDTIRSATQVYVSAATVWEFAIKANLGKLKGDARALVEAIAGSGMLELPIRAQHAVLAGALPPHHNDPFDRMLVAQAITEPLRLLTADPILAMYSELVDLI